MALFSAFFKQRYVSAISWLIIVIYWYTDKVVCLNDICHVPPRVQSERLITINCTCRTMFEFSLTCPGMICLTTTEFPTTQEGTTEDKTRRARSTDDVSEQTTLTMTETSSEIPTAKEGTTEDRTRRARTTEDVSEQTTLTMTETSSELRRGELIEKDEDNLIPVIIIVVVSLVTVVGVAALLVSFRSRIRSGFLKITQKKKNRAQPQFDNNQESQGEQKDVRFVNP